MQSGAENANDNAARQIAQEQRRREAMRADRIVVHKDRRRI